MNASYCFASGQSAGTTSVNVSFILAFERAFYYKPRCPRSPPRWLWHRRQLQFAVSPFSLIILPLIAEEGGEEHVTLLHDPNLSAWRGLPSPLVLINTFFFFWTVIQGRGF